jgi:hypothetical protein
MKYVLLVDDTSKYLVLKHFGLEPPYNCASCDRPISLSEVALINHRGPFCSPCDLVEIIEMESEKEERNKVFNEVFLKS